MNQTSDLEATMRCCQQERQQFYHHGVKESPCCLDLFRRAFGGDQTAWEGVWQLFEPQMRKWIEDMWRSSSPQQRRSVENLGLLEPDDLLNELMLHLFLKAPAYPYLVQGNELGPVLDFLKRKVKLAILEKKRKAGKHAFHLSLEDSVPSPTNVQHQVEQDDLIQRLAASAQELFQTEDERWVFDLYLICAWKPEDIQSLRPDLFPTIQALRNTIKRVKRRLHHDEAVQQLFERTGVPRQKPAPDAFLEMRMLEETEQGAQDMPIPCHLDEDRLLDYVLGDPSDDLRAAVEQSPACLQEAHRLRHELALLQRMFYRSTCPDAETLIAYQEGRLAGTEQLRLRKHLAFCPLCQEELAMLAAADAAPAPEPLAHKVRRVLQATFQPPLATALRGTILHYQTPHATIHLTFSQRIARGKSRTWSLRGQMRSLDGHLITGMLEEVEAQRTDQPHPPTTGTIEANGSFVFAGLPAGVFTVRLMTAEETIELEHIVIGDDVVGDGDPERCADC
ncbi:MAG: zf-HC2 domain-containing protein [Chloroflexaceae bacterium]|nr:zf-HC2 domain-containing protein [Chloroflexaceae bacterium]